MASRGEPAFSPGSDHTWRQCRAPGLTVAQADHVARRVAPGHACGLQALHVGHEALLHRVAVQRLRRRAEEALVPVRHRPGLVVGVAADHHAVDVAQLRVDLRRCR